MITVGYRRGSRRGGSLVGALSALVVVLGSGIVSCSTGDQILFFVDEHFESGFLTGQARTRLDGAVEGLGADFGSRSLSSDVAAEAFIELVSDTTASFLIASPFLADAVSAAAPVAPEKRFIVLFADGLAPQPNIQRLVTDRTASFTRAGRFSARLAAGLAPETARILVLAYVGTERRERELETLIEGVTEESELLGQSVPTPVIQRYQSLQDGRIAARESTNLADDFDVVFVALSSMSADVLTELSGRESIYVITEGFGGPVPGGDRVVAIVEEDWVLAVRNAIDTRTPRIVIPSELVAGPAAARLEIPDVMFDFE